MVVEGELSRISEEPNTLPRELLDNLCPKAFEILEPGREGFGQVVELARDVRQPHLIPAAFQALVTILVVACNGPFRGIGA